jgi:2-polyprenyl-3-methyl-5-hydroxy-6-metoxy-1,4-benzoquinol methylase
LQPYWGPYFILRQSGGKSNPFSTGQKKMIRPRTTKSMANYTRHPASFKDPSGFIFESNGKMYRQVNRIYSAEYDLLMNSGLYKYLVQQQFLIPHKELEENLTQAEDRYKTLLPEQIETVSYAYEWCFEELKDAALLTLQILRVSLDYGMIIKDATPFNIQFRKGKPVFIDTLSFEKYNPLQPWVAYRQFCQHFLFPLYLEYYLKADLQKTMTTYMDGIPVEITSKMLPLKSNLSLGVWLHVYTQNTFRHSTKTKAEQIKFNKKKLLNLINHLESIIKKFVVRKSTTWGNYYEETILGKEYLANKEKLFLEFCQDLTVSSALDIGANEGYFTKLLAERKIQVIATDTDSRTIGNLYQFVKKNGVTNILPLILDVTNPSPALGFNNKERSAFHDRIKTDLVIALALIHHLVIGKNISLEMIAEYFAGISPYLLVEFVPREDQKVQQMLASRKDVFTDYTMNRFERHFELYFDTLRKEQIPGTYRILYLMKRKGHD